MQYQVKSGEDLPTHFEGFLWEEPGLLPRGELSMIIGHDGVGKTSITLELAAQWSRDDEIVFMSMIEDGPEIIKARLAAYGADLDMCMFQPDRPDGFTDAHWMIPDDIDKIEAYLRTTCASVAIFDSLDAHLSSSPIGHKARMALAAMHSMAQRLKIPIIFLHHFNKGGTKTSIDQAIGGARGIKAAFRNILVWGDPFNAIEFEGDNDQPKPTHALAVHKNSFGQKWPQRPSLIYSAGSIPNPYWKGETVMKLELIDSTPMISPADIYSARHKEPESVKEEYTTARDVAADTILNILYEEKTWVPATKLEEGAIAAGASQRTVKGTRATMCRHGLIEKKKDGDAWYWRITKRGREHMKALNAKVAA